jgi:hypothetical protein
MKNEKLKIELQLVNAEKVVLNAHAFSATKPYVDCEALIDEDKKACFIAAKHPYLQTRFDLTGVIPYVLISFDESLYFESVTVSNSYLSAPFETLQTASHFILLPLKTFAEFERIDHIKLLGNGK